MHCPEGVQIHFHVCVLLCSAAAVCHHDLCWLLLCFIKYKSPRFFYFHVCVLLCSVAAVGHHDLFRLLHCFIESDLMGQGKTVLQGKCTVTCPKSHSIRFDGIGGDCAAGKVHSDLPKGSFNQICLDLCCFSLGTCYAPKDGPHDCEDFSWFGVFVVSVQAH